MLRVLKAAWILFWAILLTLILFFPIVIAALVGKRGMQPSMAPRFMPGPS